MPTPPTVRTTLVRTTPRETGILSTAGQFSAISSLFGGPLVAGVMLTEGVSEEELGLAQLREAADASLGARGVEMFLSYRVRLGVR